MNVKRIDQPGKTAVFVIDKEEAGEIVHKDESQKAEIARWVARNRVLEKRLEAVAAAIDPKNDSATNWKDDLTRALGEIEVLMDENARLVSERNAYREERDRLQERIDRVTAQLEAKLSTQLSEQEIEFKDLNLESELKATETVLKLRALELERKTAIEKVKKFQGEIAPKKDDR